MKLSTEYLSMMRLRHHESMQRGVLRLLQSSSKGVGGRDNVLFSAAGLEMSRMTATMKLAMQDEGWIVNDESIFSHRRGMQKQNPIVELYEKNTYVQNEYRSASKEPEYASAEEVKNACEQLRQNNHNKLLDAGNQIRFNNGFEGGHALANMMNVQWVNDEFVFNHKVSDPEEDSFNRQMVNRQIENILSEAGVSVNEGENLTFSIDPYSYEISVKGNITEEKRSQIESALNQGENGFNLYTHVYFCAKDEMNSTQVSQEGQLKRHMNDFFYEMYRVRLCECEKKGDDFITPDGRSVRDMIGARSTRSTQRNGFSGVDENSLKHHYLDLLQPYSYDSGETQTLEIAYTSTGLHDLHQDWGFGNGETDWIEERRTEQEQRSGKVIYALF